MTPILHVRMLTNAILPGNLSFVLTPTRLHRICGQIENILNSSTSNKVFSATLLLQAWFCSNFTVTEVHLSSIFKKFSQTSVCGPRLDWESPLFFFVFTSFLFFLKSFLLGELPLPHPICHGSPWWSIRVFHSIELCVLSWSFQHLGSSRLHPINWKWITPRNMLYKPTDAITSAPSHSLEPWIHSSCWNRSTTHLLFQQKSPKSESKRVDHPKEVIQTKSWAIRTKNITRTPRNT